MKPDDAQAPSPVFIGGCGRSGTTMLGAMLGAHPDCLTVPETGFFFVPYRRHWKTGEQLELRRALDWIVDHWSFKIWDVQLDRSALLERCDAYPQLLIAIVEAYGRRTGKPAPAVWVDHTPGKIKYTSLLFEMFPDAKLIHIVRDGRATAASVIDLDWGPNNVASAARWWLGFVSRGLAAESMHGPERVIRVRYEDLVTAPERSLERICAFIGLSYRAEMVEGRGFEVPAFTAEQHALVGRRPDPRRLEAWRDKLKPREVEVFEAVTADLLKGLGYEPLHGWSARRATSFENARFLVQELFRRNVTNRVRLRRRIRRSVSGLRSSAPGRVPPETGR